MKSDKTALKAQIPISSACFIEWIVLSLCSRMGINIQNQVRLEHNGTARFFKEFARRTVGNYDKLCSGFTLVEVLVAMVFFMICSLGLLTFTMMTFGERKSIERRNFAYSMASDIAEQLKFLPSTNALVKPGDRTSEEDNFLRYDANGEIKDCAGNSVDLWQLTNPSFNGKLYLYDANHDGTLDSAEIDQSANDKIDHPSNSDSTGNLSMIRPIRKSPDGVTTYYAVWSVRYLPCGFSAQYENDVITKVIITVYWIEPEPMEASSETLVSKISSGEYKLKHVTVSTDIVYGVHQ